MSGAKRAALSPARKVIREHFSANQWSAHFLGRIGTVSLLQMTHEAKSVLQAAEVFYVLHAQSLVFDYLRERYDAEVIDLSVAYDEEKSRNQTYSEVAQGTHSADVH